MIKNYHVTDDWWLAKMIISITSKVIKRVFYFGSVFQDVGITVDIKKIIENYTPIGVTKIIVDKYGMLLLIVSRRKILVGFQSPVTIYKFLYFIKNIKQDTLV